MLEINPCNGCRCRIHATLAQGWYSELIVSHAVEQCRIVSNQLQRPLPINTGCESNGILMDNVSTKESGDGLQAIQLELKTFVWTISVTE